MNDDDIHGAPNGPNPVGGAAAAAAAPDAEQDPAAAVRIVGVEEEEERQLEVYEFQEAIDVLEDVDDRRPIGQFIVYTRMSDDDELQAADAQIYFPRFVTFLERQRQQQQQPRHEGRGRTFRELSLYADWNELPDEHVERLFRDVLPGHPTLQGISVDVDQLPTRFLRMLTEGIPTTPGVCPLSTLRVVEEMAIHPEILAGAVRALADMLKRNVAIQRLRVDVQLNVDDCKVMCQALPGNTNLQYLELELEQVHADTMEGLNASSLRELRMLLPFTNESISYLACQLRMNEKLHTLAVLHLQGTVEDDGASVDLGPLLDLVKTYNCTLRSLRTDYSYMRADEWLRDQLDAYFVRNRRIRDACEELRHPDSTQRFVVPRTLLPSVLGLMSDMPTALFRLLKMGYVNPVSECLRRHQNARRRRHRRQQPVRSCRRRLH